MRTSLWIIAKRSTRRSEASKRASASVDAGNLRTRTSCGRPQVQFPSLTQL